MKPSRTLGCWTHGRDIRRVRDELKDDELSLPERQELEEELKARLAKLSGAHDGVSLELISDRLKQQEGIAEFFYQEGAGTQRASDWSEAVWEKNREAYENIRAVLSQPHLPAPAGEGIRLKPQAWRRLSIPESTSFSQTPNC